MGSNKNVAILSPGFPPAYGGGAPIYTDLLVRGLVKIGFPGKLYVITEKFSGQSKVQRLENGKINILRVFPNRSATETSTFTRYPKYVIQNLQFATLPKLINQYGIDTILVHSSFHIKPGILHWVLAKEKQKRGIKLIADMREPKLPLGQFNRLYPYDSIVCCARSVYNHIIQDKKIKERVSIIPIPMPPDIVTLSDEQVSQCLRKYGLDGNKFLFNANGILKEKRTDLSLDVVRRLRDLGQDISLVVAGKKRDWNAACDAAKEEGILHYIGVLSNKDIFAFYQASELVVNFSSVEGMPRLCLEAMSVGANVLLPQGVPEFAESCPESVMVSNNPSELASQVLAMMDRGTKNKSSGYDLSKHKLDWVADRYKALILDTLTMT